jgi:uncharacterized protein (TIGR02246 family)
MSAEQEEVRRTLALYAHRHDGRDADGYADLFAVDGSFVSARAQHRGRAAVKEFISELYRSQPADRRTKHLCGNSTIDVDGRSATAVTDFVAYERQGDGPWQVHTIGQYQDKLVLEDGMWRFAERHVVTGAAGH